ncbi:hypothetical protein BGW37DRAFT_487053 [Umbelopsis sp. PMI_123]|nr:hypothetical protein BGW37DRAFT_487053 [Umbelopsis sp. PMI_123]
MSSQHYPQFQAKKLTEYYEASVDPSRLPLQRLQISHPDEVPPMKRMVSVHELDVNFNEKDQFSTVSSGRSQGTPTKRQSKPLPRPPIEQQKQPLNVMSPLTLPQQFSPIMRQTEPVYNSIFGYSQGDNTETYSSVINSTYESPLSTQFDQPTTKRSASIIKSRRRSVNTDPVPNPQYLLSPDKTDFLDCSDNEAASLYSYHSVLSNHRSIASRRSVENISEIPKAEQRQKTDTSSFVYPDEEEDSTEYTLPALGIMGGGWKLHINNPSRETEDESSPSHTPPSERAVTPQDYSMPMRRKGSKELADNLFADSLMEEPIRSVSPFWQQVAPMTQSPSQLEYLLQPTVFLDPTRAGASSPVSSLGTSSFTDSYRHSGSEFSYDNRSSSPGLNMQHPFVNAVNEMATQEYRNSWTGPSPEWLQSMTAAKQRSSVPPPPVATPMEEPTEDNAKSRYSIASHSLTNDPETVKTMRRMANLTKDHKTQTVYAMYLLEVCQMHEKIGGNSGPMSATRERLLREAIYWIERLSKERHAEPSYIKGLWHQKGLHGYKMSEEKAQRLWERAAKSGHTKAKFKLAQYQEKKGNTGKAVAYYKSATVKGGVEPNFKMAKILLYGELKQKRNVKLGLEYLRRAADLANSTVHEPAFMMGQIYTGEFKKVDIPKELIHPDSKLGVKYISKAAKLGNADALDRMARIHQYGAFDEPLDLALSFRYYEKAADRGQFQSMLNLSKMYLEGQAVEANEALAFKWCERSAASGYDHAEFALGYYYEMGIGVTANYPRALEYYGKAATKGNEAAAAALNRNSKDNGGGKVVHHTKNITNNMAGRDDKRNSKECTIM